MQIKQCIINISLSPCLFLLSCLSSNFTRRKEEHTPTLNKSLWLNDESIILLSLATVSALRAKGIDSLFVSFFPSMESQTSLPLFSSDKTEGIMSGSGNNGADNKISDEEEALGWYEKVTEVLSCCCCSLSKHQSLHHIFLHQENLFFSFSLNFCIYIFYLLPFLQDRFVYQIFISV